MIPNKKMPSEPLPEDELQILEPEDPPAEKKSFTVSQIWNKIQHFGLGESSLRIGTALASLLLIALVIWVMSKFFLKAEKNTPAVTTAVASQLTKTPVVTINKNITPLLASGISVFRLAQIHTNLPPKPRVEIISYTVVQGDSLFGIAAKYGLDPESLYWSNKGVLGSNADDISPGLTLLIPPEDGAVHVWDPIDGLNGVAKGYQVTVDTILDWPGNHLNRATIGDYSFPNIKPGTLIFIPGGQGTYTDWLPDFTRETAAVASSIGPGFCGKITDGPIGTGSFIWPTTETYLSGYDYTAIHHGIDIAGQLGNPVFAVDDGVVVYSGWNNVGYGNLIIVDHGNGWQSVYAHLSVIEKACGDYVFKGDTIGQVGSTGNSSGPHLHFELRNRTYGTVNPWDFLQK